MVDFWICLRVVGEISVAFIPDGKHDLCMQFKLRLSRITNTSYKAFY